MNGRASDFHDEIDTRICDLLMDGVSYERQVARLLNAHGCG